jgi:hypothetical protein
MDKKPRRYRLRFGLKTLFVLIGALAVWLGAVTNQKTLHAVSCKIPQHAAAIAVRRTPGTNGHWPILGSRIAGDSGHVARCQGQFDRCSSV